MHLVSHCFSHVYSKLVLPFRDRFFLAENMYTLDQLIYILVFGQLIGNFIILPV
jgi:hypothetical protein